MLDEYVERDNNIKRYRLPVGFTLYHGTKKNNIVTDQSPTTFFAFTQEVAEQYGVASKYTTNKEYLLIAADDSATMEYIHSIAPPNIQNIIERNYGLRSKKRNSLTGPDKEFLKFVCSIGYNGYVILNMNTDFGGVFHKEAGICNPDVTFVEIATEEDRRAELSKTSPPRVERKTKRSNFDISPVKRIRLFDDSDDDDIKPVKLDFGKSAGGKKRKTKRSKKSAKKKAQ
jgi:hypothetical protein